VKRHQRISLLHLTSLLLLAALLTLWVRSYWRADGLTQIQPGRQSGVWSHRGRLLLDSIGRPNVPVWHGQHGWQYLAEPPTPAFIDHPAANARGAFGFAWATGAISTIAIPYWPLAVLLLLPSAMALKRAARRRACRRKQICDACGYDLRASPQRCPECGAAIEASTPGQSAAQRSAAPASSPADHADRAA
jgi:hypothetical protein